MAFSDYPVADSQNAGANSVAPGAGAGICSFAAPPKGYYEIRLSASVGVGAVAADNGNVKLLYNGAAQLAAVPTNGAELIIPRVLLDGVSVVALSAVGAATAAVVYTARITLTRLQ